MKRSFFIGIGASIFLFASSFETKAATQTINSTIKDVTVYHGQAMITRVGSVDLAAGEQSVTIENIPSGAEAASFQVSVRGPEGSAILGFNSKEERHLESRQKKALDLENQIKDLEQSKIKELDDRIGVLEEQRKFLLAIGQNGSSEMNRQISAGAIDIAKWETAFGFFGKRLALVADSLRILTREKSSSAEKLQLLKEELASMQNSNSNITKSVQVDLMLTKGGSVEITLRYLVPNAHWSAVYDAKYNPSDNKVSLNYFAEVYQKTGEDWENINLILSTARPTQNAGPGKIEPWYLSLIVYEEDDIDGLIAPLADISSEKKKSDIIIRGGRVGEEAYRIDGYHDNEADILSFESSLRKTTGFDVAYQTIRKETIPSGDKIVRCPVAQSLYDSKIQLTSKPRKVEGVFRQVTLTNKKEGILMPGMVNIFSGEDFLGKTDLKEAIMPEQEFELPFGLDNEVTAKREIISRKKSVQGDDEQLDETAKIILKNNGALSKTIALEDALPISQDNRVKIKIKNIEPVQLSTNEKGIAKWEITLAPHEEKAVTISYKVSYPSSATILGL